MFRWMKGRWMLAIFGALATAYVVRRRNRGRRREVRIDLGNASRMGRDALDSAVRVGKAVVDAGMRAVVKQKN